MFLLSSLQRLRGYIGINDTLPNNKILSQLLMSSSENIQKFLSRRLQKTTYTEYFDVDTFKLRYPIKAPPIASITSVYSDTTGLYDGSESEQVDYYIDPGSYSIVLNTPVARAPKGLRAIYIGGIAEHATRATLALTSISGTFTAGKYVTGSLSGSVGIVVSTITETPIIIETLTGAWEVGDVLSLQNTEGGANVAGISATVSAIILEPLTQISPDIVEACEMQCRYDWKHKDDYETSGVNKDGTTYRSGDKALQYSGISMLRPEVRSRLYPYKRLLV